MDKTKYYVIGSILTAFGVSTAYYIHDVSNDGVEQTAKYEGYKANPYRDTGGVITQGNGSTIRPDGTKIQMTDPPISKKEALRYLHAHITRHSAQFNQSLYGIKLSQPEYDLYADFTYQYGIAAWKRADMLKHLKKGQYVQACQALEGWRFSRVGKKKIKVKVDCRLDSRCRGVWNRQKERIEKCLEQNK